MDSELAPYLVSFGFIAVLAWFLRKFLARLSEPPPEDSVHPPKRPAVASRLVGGLETFADDEDPDAEDERREWRRKTGTR